MKRTHIVFALQSFRGHVLLPPRCIWFHSPLNSSMRFPSSRPDAKQLTQLILGAMFQRALEDQVGVTVKVQGLNVIFWESVVTGRWECR